MHAHYNTEQDTPKINNLRIYKINKSWLARIIHEHVT